MKTFVQKSKTVLAKQAGGDGFYSGATDKADEVEVVTTQKQFSFGGSRLREPTAEAYRKRRRRELMKANPMVELQVEDLEERISPSVLGGGHPAQTANPEGTANPVGSAVPEGPNRAGNLEL